MLFVLVCRGLFAAAVSRGVGANQPYHQIPVHTRKQVSIVGGGSYIITHLRVTGCKNAGPARGKTVLLLLQAASLRGGAVHAVNALLQPGLGLSF